jgi:transposase
MFSKNRHGRFQESNLFEQLFEEVVSRCLAVGLVRGDKLSVDGTFVEANAFNHESSWPKPRRSIERCASTWLTWKGRIQ